MSDMLQLVVEDRMRPQINTNETDRMANSLSDPSHLFLSVATIVSASKRQAKAYPAAKASRTIQPE